MGRSPNNALTHIKSRRRARPGAQQATVTIEHECREKVLEHHLHGPQIAEVLAHIELEPQVTIDKFPHALSGGQRQRVNLAMALAVGADLILADEPTSMLDVSIHRSVLDHVPSRHRARHRHPLHHPRHRDGTAPCRSEAVMFAGQIVEWGPSQEIIANPHHPYTRVLLSSVPDPASRLSGDLQSGRSFSQHAEPIRGLAVSGRADDPALPAGRCNPIDSLDVIER